MHSYRRQLGYLLFALHLVGLHPAAGAPVELAKFTGLTSCQSSSCHGGGAGRDQCDIWSTRDFHARAFAILLTSRSQRIAETLHFDKSDASANPRCTVCHSPMQSVPQDRLLPAAHADQGVSCENCHAPAENWLRSHTRHDYTYFQRVASGMNDLRNLYQRANTCVACHENLPSDMASAGHPELIFELDSQLVSEPPHWHESDPWAGLHSWLTGQAVAFREETWRMIKEPGESARWESLGWLLQEVTAQLKTLPDLEMPKPPATPQQLGRLQAQSNRLARAAPGFTWTPGISQQLFRQLTKTGDQLRRVNGGDQQVHRAEVITQSLDRLLAELAAHQVAPPGADKGVDNLFADLRQPLYFNRDKFCADLDALAGMAAK